MASAGSIEQVELPHVLHDEGPVDRRSAAAAAQHLDRLKQMQTQIYEILSKRSGRPLNKIIRDTKRTDFYLDATKALEYGLIDGIVDG